jgi:hypothetical protein
LEIRSTEKPHVFAERLFGIIPIYGLQGLTLDSNYNFTAGIEAAEFGSSETVDAILMFSTDEWIAKLCLCNELSLPLYAVTFKSGSSVISIYQICSHKGARIQAILHKTLETKSFADWWSILKGTEQTAPLYEAGPRVSYFDRLLDERKLSWGGNIDGFILNSNMRAQAIIETRYTEKNPLEGYDPAIFFPPHYTRKGDYKTWEPVVLLAARLEIPLFLFTFERKSDKERMGFAVVDSISQSKQELEYQDTPPHKNIVEGIANIRHQIIENLSRKPPHKN